jgi:hypothetical protein
MDNPASTSLSPEPSDRKALFSALGWLGVIFIFALIVAITYLRNQSEDLDEIYVEERLLIKAQVEAEQTKNATTYQWINQAEGQVRLPTERGKALLLAELKEATQ